MKKAGFKNFLLLWGASLISATGSGMTSFALGIYIFQKTGLSSLTGLLILLGFLPGLLMTPLAGVLADRYDRRLLMMLGDGLSILGLLIILISMTLPDRTSLVAGIGLGVTISSFLSSLVESSFKATISDLLDKKDFSRASGMIQLVSSARYLLSPILAGLLLSISSVRIIIILDILTILLTLPITYIVKKEMKQAPVRKQEHLKSDFKLAFTLLQNRKGVWYLVLFGILISFCLGSVQTLLTPMVLAFSNSRFLGFVTTFSSCGMLAAGLLLSRFKITKGFVSVLLLSLTGVGLSMIGFASRENHTVMTVFGFILFGCLTFANMAIDYLVRTNLPREHQGKAWGLIGIISQMGYIIAYAGIGLFVDYFAKPLLIQNGLLANNFGQLIGVGAGRGAALVIILSGCLLLLTTYFLARNKDVKKLEESYVMDLNQK